MSLRFSLPPSGPSVYLTHREPGHSDPGYARYDASSGYFSCRTCGFEQRGDEFTQPCSAGCPELATFDGVDAMVCDRGHRVAVS